MFQLLREQSWNLVHSLEFSAGFTAFLITVGAIGIIGFILFMVAMYRLSHYYNEPRIFKNVLYAFIISIISGVTSLFWNSQFLHHFLKQGYFTTGQQPLLRHLHNLLLTYLVVLGVSIVFGIVNAVLYMRAFNKLDEKSGVDNFKYRWVTLLNRGNNLSLAD